MVVCACNSSPEEAETGRPPRLTVYPAQPNWHNLGPRERSCLKKQVGWHLSSNISGGLCLAPQHAYTHAHLHTYACTHKNVEAGGTEEQLGGGDPDRAVAVEGWAESLMCILGSKPAELHRAWWNTGVRRCWPDYGT